MQWLNSLHLAYPRVAKSTICLAVVVPGVAATLAGIRRAIKLEQDTTAQMQIRHTLPNRCLLQGCPE